MRDHVALFATFVGDVADIGLGVFAAGNNGGIFNRGHIDNFALFAPLAAASLSGVVRGAGGKGRGGVEYGRHKQNKYALHKEPPVVTDTGLCRVRLYKVGGVRRVGEARRRSPTVASETFLLLCRRGGRHIGSALGGRHIATYIALIDDARIAAGRRSLPRTGVAPGPGVSFLRIQNKDIATGSQGNGLVALVVGQGLCGEEQTTGTKKTSPQKKTCPEYPHPLRARLLIHMCKEVPGGWLALRWIFLQCSGIIYINL